MEQSNWKTTLLGILTIVSAVVAIAIQLLNGQMPTMEQLLFIFGLLTGGAGLIKARDAQSQ